MDEFGNYWEEETDNEGYSCYRIYYNDGSMQDCDGNKVTTDGYVITDEYEDPNTGNLITVSEDMDGNIVTETYDPTTGESTEVISNVDGLVIVHEEYDS